jgi:hypothetical protein
VRSEYSRFGVGIAVSCFNHRDARLQIRNERILAMNSKHSVLTNIPAIRPRFFLDSSRFWKLLSHEYSAGSDVVRILNQPSRPWGSLKRFVLLLACSLAFGLACSELPELLTLNDDTSNDFVEISSSLRVELPQVVRQQSESPRVTIPPRAPSTLVVAMIYPQPALASGTDLLHILALQRR